LSLTQKLGKRGRFAKVSNSEAEIMAINAGVTTHKIKWCDLRCEDADFARLDAMDGSCRTFQSLWCGKLEKHVTKNSPCEITFGKRRPTTGL